MKYILLLITLLFVYEDTSAQAKELVINYLENRLYADKSDIEFLIDNQKTEIPAGLLEDLEKGMRSGIDNSSIFNKSKKSKLLTDSYDISEQKQLTNGPSHYLIILKLLNLELNNGENEDSGQYKFSADIKCFDLIKGINIMQRRVNQNGDFLEISRLASESTSMTKSLEKLVREATTKELKNQFPTANYVTKLGEVKGEKVKTVVVNSVRYNKQNKPKYAYAHIVDKEVEVDGKTVYIFKLVGLLSQPKKVKTYTQYQVGDGKKQLLAAFNEGKEIYVTIAPLGPGL